ncbi:hypothetical protein [Histidinibacterium aquaticum]|uniref:Uncharacterized protein n=1 Tax=Histidinibacterium aquaticum TaxID=2613962 RepID=A0A5J5GJK4_9RHOB|nr:hypothetical protein [Histidinibacterium aquaticum]KAA9008325.1 hypothetical protein F3S47_12620 [Histidinibacterium aquaticum]
MDRIALVFTLAAGAVLALGLAMVAVALGWQSPWVILLCLVLGFLLSGPVVYPAALRIRRHLLTQKESHFGPQERQEPPRDEG